jgi:cupin fold WbuC family metalloprotein
VIILHLERVNDEVVVLLGETVSLGDAEINLVKGMAERALRRRARICMHASRQDLLHEMLIGFSGSSYIPPHRHYNKSESFHVVEGEVDVVLFDDLGGVVKVIRMGACGSGKVFFHRLNSSRYHTLLIRSDTLVIHEVTNGPFDPNKSDIASFAPDESDIAAVERYMRQLDAQVEEWSGSDAQFAGQSVRGFPL